MTKQPDIPQPSLDRTLGALAVAACGLMAIGCSPKQAVGTNTAATTAVNTGAAADTLVVMSYNVENFFDPEDDPTKEDEEFTPDGTYHWTLTRMQKKAVRIARVITSANSWSLPDVVGLCEVEGPTAVADLLKEGGLKSSTMHYEPVCFPTSDGRGIATALIYNADRMEPLSTYPIYASLPAKGLRTRDIAYAKLKVKSTGDVFHFMMNHWPSKRNENPEGEWRRDYVAQVVKHACDSILGTDADAKIVLMGDFNDGADSRSLNEVLGAKTKCAECPLRNLSADTELYSYKYRQNWNTIDHVIVTPGVCRKGRPVFNVVNLPFLLEKDERNGGLKPKRTYNGRKFNYGADNEGGYSDHLPVMIKVVL